MKDQVSLLYVTPSISRDIGGIFEVERNLALELYVKGIPVDVVSLIDGNTEADFAKWHPVVPECHPIFGPQIIGYSRHYLKRLLSSRANVAHIHSLWSYTTYALFQWSIKTRAPYLITANGMLDDWALKNSKWKKDLALFVCVNRILKNAHCIQVNSMHEYHSIRKLGLKNPVCKISNGVTLPDLSETFEAPWANIPATQGKNILLYLGRIHPKKGADLLLKAWHQIFRDNKESAKNWHLMVVGFRFDNSAYEGELSSYVEDNGLKDTISFLPGQYGDGMHSCYANCDAFILPSFSEGVPLAVLHAWSFGKPVIMTAECNLGEGFDARAAIEIKPEVGSIKEGILQLIDAEAQKLVEVGNKGLELVKEKFTWDAVASELIEVYNWMHSGKGIPSTIIQD